MSRELFVVSDRLMKKHKAKKIKNKIITVTMHGSVFEFKSSNNASKTHGKKVIKNCVSRRIVNRYYFSVA